MNTVWLGWRLVDVKMILCHRLVVASVLRRRRTQRAAASVVSSRRSLKLRPPLINTPGVAAREAQVCFGER